MSCPRLHDLPSPPLGKTGWPWTEETSLCAGTALKRISIVTPSYNQAGFIEETIRSVLLQGYPNLEYIIMDGGSTDGSVDVIQKYAKFLTYWVSEKDDGASDAIRKGFERATGEIFAYLNSDDLYQPGALQQVEAGFSRKGADVVYGNMYWMDQHSAVVGEKRQTPFSRLGYIYGGADLPQQATFWTKEIYRRCGGMDPSFQFAFDMDLFSRFMVGKAKFVHVRHFVAAFRMHEAQKSHLINDAGRRETNKIRERSAKYPVKSIQGAVLRNVARIQRILWYVSQGDFLWLVGRIPDRLLSRTSAAAHVGPRSRWM